MTNYQKAKAAARVAAIEYALDGVSDAPSWGELAELSAYLYRIGKRYGLLKEFRENGII